MTRWRGLGKKVRTVVRMRDFVASRAAELFDVILMAMKSRFVIGRLHSRQMEAFAQRLRFSTNRNGRSATGYAAIARLRRLEGVF